MLFLTFDMIVPSSWYYVFIFLLALNQLTLLAFRVLAIFLGLSIVVVLLLLKRRTSFLLCCSSHPQASRSRRLNYAWILLYPHHPHAAFLKPGFS